MKFTVITLFALALLTSCGHGGGKAPSGSVHQDWKVDVYAMENYDDLMAGRIDSADDTIMREASLPSSFTSVSDTARVNRAIRARLGVLDSLGINTAWMPCGDSAKVSLVLFDSEALLTDTIHACEITDCSDCDKGVVVAFSFTNRHEWEYVTRDRVGCRIAVAVNGEVVNTPVVNRPISGGGCTVVMPEYRARQIFPGALVSMRKND